MVFFVKFTYNIYIKIRYKGGWSMRGLAIILSFFIMSCSAEGLFEDKNPAKTRLYVHNNLTGFFRLIDFVKIRKSGETSYGSDLLIGSSGVASVFSNNLFWKTHLQECDINIDVRVEVKKNSGPNTEIFEYLGLPVKCGQDYKWVIEEPSGTPSSYTSEGCMQTTSSVSKQEDSRISEKCGIGV